MNSYTQRAKQMGRQTRDFKLETLENQKHKIACKECSRETLHTIIASYKETGSDECGFGQSVGWTSQNQIIQCLGCESVTFREVSSCSEDCYHDYEENETIYPETIKYYPARTTGLKAINTYLLPTKLQSIYEETRLAIENEQNVLAGIGVRALIETVCKDQSATGKNLFEQINSLKEKSILTNDGADALHKLRSLGNDAAHEVKAHTKDQLLLALQIVDHMLDGTYIIPQNISQVFPIKTQATDKIDK